MEDFTGTQSACLKNRCAFNEDYLREAMAGYARRPLYAILYLALALIALTLVVLQIILFSLHALQTTLLIESLVIVLLAVFLIWFHYGLQPRYTAKLQIKRHIDTGRPAAYETCAMFLEQEILGSADVSNDLLHLQYDTIRRVFKTKRLIVLVTKNRLLLMLDPQRFENGTEADFRKLLSEKCPGLRLPK